MTQSRTRAFVLSVALLGVTLVTSASRADEPVNVETCANAAEESQALRRDGKLTQARRALVTCARAGCPAFIRKDCTGWLAEVERNLPSVVIRAIDAKGKDLTKVRVLADGVVLAESLDGRPINIDPGEHAITYETDGAAPVTETVLIRQAETSRLLTVTFAAPPAAAPPVKADKETEKGKESAAATPHRSIPIASWILGGGGLVLGGLGVALWASGTSDHASLESGCAVTRSCAQSDVDSAQTKLLVGDIAIGAGIVAIGAAVVLALVSKDAAPASRAMARFGLVPRPLGPLGPIGPSP
jgi:hypothetical protein